MNRWERKEKIGHGGISEVARELELSPATVSLVVSDKTDQLSDETIGRVQDAVAARIGEPREVVFPVPAAA
jgi:hypothetical protein